MDGMYFCQTHPSFNHVPRPNLGVTVGEFCLRCERLSSPKSLALRGLGLHPRYAGMVGITHGPWWSAHTRVTGSPLFPLREVLAVPWSARDLSAPPPPPELHNALWGRLKTSSPSSLSRQVTILLLPRLAGPHELLWLSRVHLTKSTPQTFIVGILPPEDSPKEAGYLTLLHACMLSHFSCVWLFVTPWTVALQAPRSMGLTRQKYRSGWSCPSLGDLPNPGIEPSFPLSPALAGGFFITSTTYSSEYVRKAAPLHDRAGSGMSFFSFPCSFLCSSSFIFSV